MAGKILALAVASFMILVSAQTAFARSTREAPAAPDSLLTDLIAKAGEAVKKVQGTIFDAVGVKNEEEFNQYLQTETKSYVAKLETLASELKKTADESVDKIGNSEAVQQLRSRVDEALADLKKENPETAKNIEQLTNTTKSLIDGISKIGDSESGKQIKEIGNKILTTAVDTLKEVDNKIQETVKS